MPTDTSPDSRDIESDLELERVAKDLRDQVRMAKDRISDRYAKLMEERSFEPEDRREG